mmetsp:Transcript_36253/g.78897  ORF Transcript_36253/g.78897 Transcript_36253/m.78897 type:complete len:227 (+) Transcript_36253:1109-1789(+)
MCTPPLLEFDSPPAALSKSVGLRLLPSPLPLPLQLPPSSLVSAATLLSSNSLPSKRGQYRLGSLWNSCPITNSVRTGTVTPLSCKYSERILLACDIVSPVRHRVLSRSKVITRTSLLGTLVDDDNDEWEGEGRDGIVSGSRAFLMLRSSSPRSHILSHREMLSRPPSSSSPSSSSSRKPLAVTCASLAAPQRLLTGPLPRLCTIAVRTKAHEEEGVDGRILALGRW